MSQSEIAITMDMLREVGSCIRSVMDALNEYAALVGLAVLSGSVFIAWRALRQTTRAADAAKEAAQATQKTTEAEIITSVVRTFLLRELDEARAAFKKPSLPEDEKRLHYRKFTLPFKQLHALHKRGVVDSNLIRVLVPEDDVDRLLTSGYPIGSALEKKQDQDMFQFFAKLFNKSWSPGQASASGGEKGGATCTKSA